MAFAEKQMTKRQMLKKDLFPFSIQVLIYSYFIFFPFGQLLRFDVTLFNVSFAFHPLDLITCLAIPLVLLSKSKPHLLRKHFYFFLYIAFFSLLLASVVYPSPEIIKGSFYLVRFISYYFFFELIWNTTENNKQKTRNKAWELDEEKVLSIVMFSLLATAMLGWLQYFFAPDLRYLKIFHWDDHYYRLAGTILDPGFMGILMVFGVFISVGKYIKTKKKLFLATSLLFLITCLFTYARASYIALVIGLGIFLYTTKKFKYIFLPIFIISIIIFSLPRGGGEGVNLLRTNSIFEKAKNYTETVEIISDHPLFGVGYNTLCAERKIRFHDEEGNHACPGSDSSILFILATTGMLGLFALIKIILVSIQSVKQGENSFIIIPIAGALLVHSLFLNSLVYPWVLGILVVLLGVSLRGETTKQSL